MKQNYNRSELESSVQVFKNTVPMMRNHGIPLTPENYAIWYTYNQGTVTPLNQAIKNNLANGIEFSKQINKSLHQEYIESPLQDNDKLEGYQQETKNLIEALLQEIALLSGGSDTYLSSMETCEKQLSNNPDVSQLTQILGNVVIQTKQMNEKNRGLIEKLQSMEGEVESLRNGVEILTLEATTDELTGLVNRRGFEKKIKKIQQVYKETKQPYSLLLLDIDHFKKFNDSYGHAIGDKVLAYVGDTIKSQIEEVDIAARFGGEEFVVVLANTGSADAVGIANKIRVAISNRNLRSKMVNESLGNITVSIGVATLALDEEINALIDRADIAMYRAKTNGRNQVCG